MLVSLSRSSIIGLGLSVVLGMSASGLLVGWLALELNLVMFTGYMASTPGDGGEAKLKYFLIQSVGSSLLFMGSVLSSASSWAGASLIMVTGLSLKLGFAPLHNWYINIMSALSGPSMLLIMTIQKIIPLILLIKLLSSPVLGFLVVTGLLGGCVGAMHQQSWKPLLGYSSVFGGGWILIAAPHMGLVVVFLSSYGMAVWLALSAGGLGQGVSDSLGENLSGTSESRGCLLVALLSLAGVPPFLGFYAKVMVLMASGAPLSGVFVLLAAVSSVFLLYMYLRLFYFLVTGRLLEGLVSLAGTSGWASPLVIGLLVIVPLMLIGL